MHDKPTPIDTRFVLVVIFSWAVVVAALLAFLWLWLDNGVPE